jgi:hypothetical protein
LRRRWLSFGNHLLYKVKAWVPAFAGMTLGGLVDWCHGFRWRRLLRRTARARRSESFLLLFFKKEALSFSSSFRVYPLLRSAEATPLIEMCTLRRMRSLMSAGLAAASR